MPSKYSPEQRKATIEKFEANRIHSEYTSQVAEKIYGRKTLLDLGPSSGFTINFDQLDDDSWWRLKKLSDDWENLAASRIQLQKETEDDEMFKEEKRIERERTGIKEDDFKDKIQFSDLFPKVSDPADFENSKKKSSSSASKYSDSSFLSSKKGSKVSKNVPRSECSDSAYAKSLKFTRKKHQETIQNKRVVYYVATLKRFTAASILTILRAKSSKAKSSCLLLFDFDSSMQWVPCSILYNRRDPSLISMDASSLMIQESVGKANARNRLVKIEDSEQRGTGDAGLLFHKDGEIERISKGVGPTQCLQIIKLLLGLDNALVFKSTLNGIKEKFRSGQYGSALEVMSELRTALCARSKDDIVDSLIMISVLEGRWFELLNDIHKNYNLHNESNFERVEKDWNFHQMPFHLQQNGKSGMKMDIVKEDTRECSLNLFERKLPDISRNMNRSANMFPEIKEFSDSAEIMSLQKNLANVPQTLVSISNNDVNISAVSEILLENSVQKFENLMDIVGDSGDIKESSKEKTTKLEDEGTNLSNMKEISGITAENSGDTLNISANNIGRHKISVVKNEPVLVNPFEECIFQHDLIDMGTSIKSESSNQDGSVSDHSSASIHDSSENTSKTKKKWKLQKNIVTAQRTGRLVWAQPEYQVSSYWPAETCVPNNKQISEIKCIYPGRFIMVLYFADIDAGESETWDSLPSRNIDLFKPDDYNHMNILNLGKSKEHPSLKCFFHMLNRGRVLGMNIPQHPQETTNRLKRLKTSQ